MVQLTTLDAIRVLSVAHTDSGDFFIENDKLKKEFYVLGTITKERAGLFFLEIDGERFSTHKKEGFNVGQQVICYVHPKKDSQGNVDFVVVGLEKRTHKK